MPNIAQIRGGLLEEAILFLLRRIGYEPYSADALLPEHSDFLRSGHSGLEVRGRGTWHQLDSFALWRHSPAFVYPLHLMVEAKCYAYNRPVGVEVPRNSLGVLKDISENYFTYSRGVDSFRAPRYNCAAAVFSTSGFTRGATEYAVAHQIFLIQYDNVPAIQPLIDAIFEFDSGCLRNSKKNVASLIRMLYRRALSQGSWVEEPNSVLTNKGWQLLMGSVVAACRAIGGSYFGMLQGQWPLHLLRREALPPLAFSTDLVRCRVHSNDGKTWRFVPIEYKPGETGWFELEFSLPSYIAELVMESWEDRIGVAQLKQQHFSYVDLTGEIDGVKRNVRLQLDRNWIEEYIARHSRR